MKTIIQFSSIQFLAVRASLEALFGRLVGPLVLRIMSAGFLSVTLWNGCWQDRWTDRRGMWQRYSGDAPAKYIEDNEVNHWV